MIILILDLKIGLALVSRNCIGGRDFFVLRFQNWTRFGVQKLDPLFLLFPRAFANRDRFRARLASLILGPLSARAG